MNRDVLKRLLRKALLSRIMDNLDKLTLRANLTHRAISDQMGAQVNWFNDAFNNNEDITVSSLARVLSVISEKIKLKEEKLTTVFDKKSLEIASLYGRVLNEKEQYIKDLIRSEKSIFSDLVTEWDYLSGKNKLDENEKKVARQVQDLIKGSDI